MIRRSTVSMCCSAWRLRRGRPLPYWAGCWWVMPPVVGAGSAAVGLRYPLQAATARPSRWPLQGVGRTSRPPFWPRHHPASQAVCAITGDTMSYLVRLLLTLRCIAVSWSWHRGYCRVSCKVGHFGCCTRVRAREGAASRRAMPVSSQSSTRVRARGTAKLPSLYWRLFTRPIAASASTLAGRSEVAHRG